MEQLRNKNRGGIVNDTNIDNNTMRLNASFMKFIKPLSKDEYTDFRAL